MAVAVIDNKVDSLQRDELVLFFAMLARIRFILDKSIRTQASCHLQGQPIRGLCTS